MATPKQFASHADLKEKVRVLGASGFNPQEIISSRDTRDLIVERGEQDKASEIGRFPRLLRNVESIPRGLTWAIGGFIADVRASVEAGIAAGKDLHTVYKEILAKLKPKYGRWSSSTIAYPST